MIVHWFWIGTLKCTYYNGTPSDVAKNLIERGVSFVEVVEMVS